MPHSTIQLAVVVPCRDDQDVLPETSARIAAVLKCLRNAGKIAPTSRICFVDDASADTTWSIIADFVRKGLPVVGAQRSRYRGIGTRCFHLA